MGHYSSPDHTPSSSSQPWTPSWVIRRRIHFALSTRVRGTGTVGQMSQLIHDAFETVVAEAGKARLAFLVIDEADSLTASRGADQSHHEDKVTVNTLIQRIDDVRRCGGRVVVFLCTNRFAALDPAIVRRAGRIERFDRPNATEREQLLRQDCEGLGLDFGVIAEAYAPPIRRSFVPRRSGWPARAGSRTLRSPASWA